MMRHLLNSANADLEANLTLDLFALGIVYTDGGTTTCLSLDCNDNLQCLGELAVADYNGDGVLNTTDITVFMGGDYILSFPVIPDAENPDRLPL